MCFFRRKKKRKEAQEQQRIRHEEEQKKLAEQQHAEKSKVVKPKESEQPHAKAEVKAEPKKATEEPVVKNPNAKYHVSQNKDEKSEHYKSWRVRKEGSQKTIKFFPTQLEAIEYAQDLADKAGTTIVIHKVDGSIRKQDYSKK